MLDDYEIMYTPSSSRADLIRLVQQHESNPSSSVNSKSSVASSSSSPNSAGNRGRGHRLLFSICTGWGYKNVFEEYKNTLKRRFPEMQYEAENFPVPFVRGLVGQAFSMLFMLGIAIGFLGKTFLPETVMEWIQANTMAFYGGLFVLNLIGGQMLQTGAFEISLDGKMVFSKIEAGSLPDINWLVQQIEKQL